jgi:hypothetical protein
MSFIPEFTRIKQVQLLIAGRRFILSDFLSRWSRLDLPPPFEKIWMVVNRSAEHELYYLQSLLKT